MGFAILIIFIPVYTVIGGLSIWLADRALSFKTVKLVAGKKKLLIAAGFLAAVTLTMFATEQVSESESHPWGALTDQAVAVVLTPFVIGGFLLIVALASRITRPFLAPIAAGAFFASLATPFVVPYVFWSYQQYQYRSAYDPLCKNAFVETVAHVNQAKSVAFLHDSYTEPQQLHRSKTGDWSLIVLNQSNLEYIERPATNESGLKGKAEFERVSIDGYKNLGGFGNYESPRHRYEPIEKITAEYVFLSEPLMVEHGRDFGIGGAKIAIHRREDNKLISHAQYYWSKRMVESCPEEADAGLFVYDFIADSLNIKRPEGL